MDWAANLECDGCGKTIDAEGPCIASWASSGPETLTGRKPDTAFHGAACMDQYVRDRGKRP